MMLSRFVFSVTICSTLAVISRHYYELNNNELIPDTSNLLKTSVRSAVECASICGSTQDCSLATYEQSTKECFLGKGGCINGSPGNGWTLFYKPDDTFLECQNQDVKSKAMRFCHGKVNQDIWCTKDSELLIKKAVYGDLACTPSKKFLDVYPPCGENVTDTLGSLCHGHRSCNFTIDSSKFGITNCNGGENLYIEYGCDRTYASCLRNLGVLC